MSTEIKGSDRTLEAKYEGYLYFRAEKPFFTN